jgi:methionine-rich copper-binding protein CopC
MKLSSTLLPVTTAAFVGVFAMGAAAHSDMESTTPADGATLTDTPDMIHMVFDDPMRVTMVRLLDGDGDEMPLERDTGLDPSLEFHAVPEPLGPGAYTVEWRGLSSDGHAMEGRFSFEIGN